MAMKKCKECGEEISSSAKKCPKCGKDQRNFFMKHPVLYTILILIVIAVASSSGSSDTGSATTPMTGTTTSTVQEDFTLQDGHTGSSDEYGMSYTIEGSIKKDTIPHIKLAIELELLFPLFIKIPSFFLC